jgi:hypothetical protein
MSTRIYAVEGPQGFHLVEAGTKVGALRHVAEKHFTVSVANQKTLVAAMKDGVQIETAGADESQATS